MFCSELPVLLWLMKPSSVCLSRLRPLSLGGTTQAQGNVGGNFDSQDTIYPGCPPLLQSIDGEQEYASLLSCQGSAKTAHFVIISRLFLFVTTNVNAYVRMYA